MRDSNLEKQTIQDLVNIYTLPVGMGICLYMDTNDVELKEYSLSFKYDQLEKNENKESLRDNLIRSAVLSPLQLIKHVPFVLYINDLQYNKEDTGESISMKMGIKFLDR